LDPTQDVVILLEADDLYVFYFVFHLLRIALSLSCRPPLLPQVRKVNIHVRTLSTNVPHPEAQKPIISFDIPYNSRGNDISAVTIQLGSDLLCLFFSVGPGQLHLLIWDWKSGTTILVGLVVTLVNAC
jgi:hypothetical protein